MRFTQIKLFIVFAIAAVLLTIFPACLGVPQQNVEDIFANKKLPEVLENLANPKPTITPSNNIQLQVGVIDSGVDYMHPDLANRIAYKNTSPLSTGWDFLGHDGYPYPTHINASLFALGAAIKDGKIESPKKEPLDELHRLNSLFIFSMEKALKEKNFTGYWQDIAKNTNFNLHILGAMKLKLQKESLLSDYEKLKKQNKLVNKSQLPPYLDQEYRKTLQIYLDKGISWMDGSGLPTVQQRNISELEDFDKYVKLVIDVFSRYEPFLKTYLNPYFEFRDSENKDLKDQTNNDRQLTYISEVFDAWAIKYNGQKISEDPLWGAMRHFCMSIMTADTTAKAFTSNSQDRSKLFKNVFDESLNTYENYKTKIIESGFLEPYHKRLQISQLKDLKALRDLVSNEMIFAKDNMLTDCTQRLNNNPLIQTPKSDLRLQRVKQQSNPYIHESSSLQNSHGTHVSGTIAAQNSNIGIHPMKVLIESVMFSKEKSEKITNSVKSDFKKWILSPLVQSALKIRYQEDISGLYDQFDVFVSSLFKENSLDVFFLDQVLDAIKYAGKNKIKISNISLGTGFKREVRNTAPSLDESWKEIYEFLFYEYFKFKIAEVLKQEASNSIFVVAAGNDSGWKDGDSKSALPCDLSSQFLQASPLGKDIPSNLIKNLVCVISVSKKGALSSFTDIPIARFPRVMALGEAVPSLVRTGDCSGTSQVMSEKYKAQSLPQISKPMLGHIDKKEYDDEEFSKVYSKITTPLLLIQYLYSAAVNRECFFGTTAQNRFARMSGTSMASPAVTGYLASYIIDKMNKKNKTETEIYSAEDFSPETIIAEGFQGCKKYGGNNDLSHLPRLDTVKYWTLGSDGNLVPDGICRF